MTSYKEHFSHFIAAAGERLHLAAHSHHYWPDVTRAAHAGVWDLAAEAVDQKWDQLFAEQIPELQAHIARHLGLSHPGRIAFASNTHCFVLRLLSHFPPEQSVRVFSSDSEFLSFSRQCDRLCEDGRLQWDQLSCAPFESFEERLIAQIEDGDYDLVFVSHVFFNSGFVLQDLEALAQALEHTETLLVIDGYHGFMAVPTDLGPIEDRAFYMSGGYKYAMSGEGVCFMHCPDDFVPRPADTGWFASFGELEGSSAPGSVGYGPQGQRFWGATMEPSGMLRMHAVMEWLQDCDLDVPKIHAHVLGLERYFIERLQAGELPWLREEDLTPGPGAKERGHFLTFRTPQAGALHRQLMAAQVITDYRGENLRFGLGLYHDPSDVDELCRRMQDSE